MTRCTEPTRTGWKIRGVPCLVGMTASGKSNLAERLARCGLAVQLINTDPFQSYKGFDIGTAKPDHESRSLYKLLDCAEPATKLNAVTFAKMVEVEVEAAIKRGKVPLLVGGSGFYLQTVERPLDAMPDLNEAQTQDLLLRIQRKPQELVQEIESKLQRRVEPADHYRMFQAGRQLIGLAAGSTYKDPPSGLRLRYFGLWAEGQQYERQLLRRIQAMWSAGWWQETKELVARYSTEMPAFKAIGYLRIVQGLQQPQPDMEAIVQQIFVDTRRFAKRQRTWFRNRAVIWTPREGGTEFLRVRLLQYIHEFFGS